MNTIPLGMTPDVMAEAVIDLDAIANNVRVLRDHAGSAAVMAVVKADGYGHGATQVSRVALAAGATELGVATIAEALALRGDGITEPILAWLHPPGTDFAPALHRDVQIAVSSVRQLSEVLDAAERTGVTAAVTVKIDTGLNRNGVSAADYPAMLDALLRAQSDEALRVRGMMTHMVYADNPDHPTNNFQAQLFSAMLAQARSSGVR
jgi:alanine racemase